MQIDEEKRVANHAKKLSADLLAPLVQYIFYNIYKVFQIYFTDVIIFYTYIILQKINNIINTAVQFYEKHFFFNVID